MKKGYVHDQFFHVIRQLGHLHELLGQDVKAAPFHPAFCEQVNKEIKRAYSVVAMTKENVDKARDKITSAVVGLILIVAVLAIIVTMEQVVFGNRLCLGLSCPITIPPLLKAP